MKQSICYLYEYEEYRQTRNVGFIKCIFQNDKVTFQIHGKGLACDKSMGLEMFLFTNKEDEYCVDRVGEIEGAQGVVNYMMTVEDMSYEQINIYDGILLESKSQKQYVATWKQKSVLLKHRNLESKYEENSVEVEKENEIETLENTKATDNIEVLECAEIIEGAEEVLEEIQKCEEAFTREVEQYKEEFAQEFWTAEQAQILNPEMKALPEEVVPEMGTTYEKINRQGIAELSHKDWRLANNNFLIHGYTNYHHLMIIREQGKAYLGIPGFYHKKEEAAARSFGFPNFHRLEDEGKELVDEELGTKEQFGYWCRPVTERKGVKQQYGRNERRDE